MIEIVKDRKIIKVNGFKYLHAGDIFRVVDNQDKREWMVATSEPFVTIKNGRKVIGVKSKFLD